MIEIPEEQPYDDSEWTAEELRLQLARSAKDNGWDEPGMDVYDLYDEELRLGGTL